MKRTERNTYQLQLLATLLLLVTTGIFSACSSDDTNTTPNAANDSEIRFDVGVWNMMEGTRATTFDGGTLTSGSFICTAYDANTTTANSVANINGTTVNWNSTYSSWEFSDGKRYWPASGSLDFFAYMPAALPTYITGLTYDATETPSVTHNVTFTCLSLPMTHATQDDALKEFVYAMALDQDKAGTNTTTQPTRGQVALTFQHPFARIKLQLSSAQEDIHINSITFKSIKNNGFYSHISGWTPEGETINFVATLNDDYEADDAIGTYIMVPQDWAGEIEISADWKVWDVTKTNTVSATVPTTWAAGHSYTYTLTITETDLIVDTSKYTEQW